MAPCIQSIRLDLAADTVRANLGIFGQYMPSDRHNRPRMSGVDLPNLSAIAEGRSARISQTRTRVKRSDIENAALSVLSEEGSSKLTHRLISKVAGVSLAATTYHYADKHDILVSASLRLMRKFRIFIEKPRIKEMCTRPSSGALLSSFLCASAEDNYFHFNCWAELMLHSARQPKGDHIGQAWYKMFDSLVEEGASEDAVDQRSRLRGLSDLLVGLLLVTTSQGLDAGRVLEVLRDDRDPLSAWKPKGMNRTRNLQISRATKKSAETRARVLTAAIELLAEEGPGAVTYRAVARKADVAQGTPFYQFQSISELLSEAQRQLFEDSKKRYRAAADGSVASHSSVEHLIARTSSVFWREVTEHAGRSASSYSLWVQAARDEHVRLMIWNAIENQLIAWEKVLRRLNPDIRPIDPLLAQALFVGKLIRVIAVSSVECDEAQIRAEFDRDLRAIVNSNFWS